MLESKLLSYGKVRIRVRTPPELPQKLLEMAPRHALVSLSLSLSLGCTCIALPDAVGEGVTSVMPHVLRGAL